MTPPLLTVSNRHYGWQALTGSCIRSGLGQNERGSSRLLFGWDIQAQDKGITFSNQGWRIAGMRQMAEEWGDMWPHWLVYFAVVDCDASAEKARTLGGRIILAPANNSVIGHFVVLQDPQGALFSIVKRTGLD